MDNTHLSLSGGQITAQQFTIFTLVSSFYVEQDLCARVGSRGLCNTVVA